MANWVADFLASNPGVQVVKRDRHALHVAGAGGEHVAYITGSPCHYLDAGQWLSLDTALRELSPGVYGAPGLDVRLRRDGLVEIAGTGYSQATARIGVFKDTSRQFTATWVMPAGTVEGDCIVRQGAGWRHELRLTETGLRETLTLLQKPAIAVRTDEWLTLETTVAGVSFPEGWLDEFGQSGYQFPLPTAVDADGNPAPCKRYWKDGKLYTGVPVSWLSTAKYPVTLDPDFAGMTADGEVCGRNASYAIARSTSYTFLTTASIFSVGQEIPAEYWIYRGFLKFDTSTIGADTIIAQVNLQLVCPFDFSTTDFDVQIVKYDWSGQDPLSAANREAAYDGCLAADLDASIWRNTLNMAVNTQYASGNLATAWVNKTAATYYGLRSNEDSDNSAPTNSEVIRIASANNATAAYRPVLIVQYLFSGPRLSRPWRR